jgi:hypothetical protein
MFNLVVVALIVLILWMAFNDKCSMVKDKITSVLKFPSNLLPSSASTTPAVVASAQPATVEPASTTAATPTVEGFSDYMSPVNTSDLLSVDYATATQKMALEASVTDSHKKFASELRKKTGTASNNTERDDSNDVNPWVGLRRPKYRTVASSQADARSVSSESPDQMLDYRPFTL